MTNLELYINHQLCEIENPVDFSVYLKRQLLSPTELAVKDAQRSYDISLPATATNNAIFGYTNTEEVHGKFSRLYDAILYVNGMKIFEGKFKMSEIGKTYYKGNLGIPAPKTIKDVFGETKMGQAGKWYIDFGGVGDMTIYNKGEHDRTEYGDISPCIFPFVLYSLLPKRDVNGRYSDKKVLDDSVVFDKEFFRPSVNCIHMLRKIFNNAGYELSGTAMDDERLRNLYVSYKNPKDYKPSWSTKGMSISGKWGSLVDGVMDNSVYVDSHQGFAVANLFHSNNLRVGEIVDTDFNIIETKTDGTTDISFTVPKSGVYKLEFEAVQTVEAAEYNHQNSFDGLGVSAGDINTRVELKVVRHENLESIQKEKFDNYFYKDNENQEINADGCIFPKEGEVHFIDPKQNAAFICGFAWGNAFNEYAVNPASSQRHNPMAIKGGVSWDLNGGGNSNFRAYSAVNNSGYIQRSGTVWIDTGKYKVTIENAPETKTTEDSEKTTGKIAQLIWLEQGEKLSVVSVSQHWIQHNNWTNFQIDFSLSLTPFQEFSGWLDLTDTGKGKSILDWDDISSFPDGKLDLVPFLPKDVKIDDWVDKFCKTFNLSLIQSGINQFRLDVPKDFTAISDTIVIDLDDHAHIDQRKNTSFKLPGTYEFGFTNDQDEEGYYRTMKKKLDEKGRELDEWLINSGDSGGEEYKTGSIEDTKTSVISAFSHCWYMELEDVLNKETLRIPVVTDHTVWEKTENYMDVKDELFYDKNQRFWYHANNYYKVLVEGVVPVEVAKVTDRYTGNRNLVLNYRKEPDSIASTYFPVLRTKHNSHYTVVDCFLRPQEYELLDKAQVRFNGDYYNVAEIDGYDPLCKKKATLKLVKRIL